MHGATIKIKKCSYIAINLYALLFGCETWSLKLRGKYRLKVSEKRKLRKIFESKTDETTSDRMRLQ